MDTAVEDVNTTQGAELARVSNKLAPAIVAFYKEHGPGYVFHAADLVEYVDRVTGNDNAPASAQRILQVERVKGTIDYLVTKRSESTYQLVELGTSDYSKRERTHGLIKMPEGVQLALSLYVTSDKTGMEICYTVAGLTAFVHKLLDTVDIDKMRHILPPVADDWRVMTKEEIKDYQRREAEEENERDNVRVAGLGPAEVDEEA